MTNQFFYREADKWFAERLWHARMRGETIPTPQLIGEFENRKGRCFHDMTKARLKKMIPRIRNRINQRQSFWAKRRREYASELTVPEELVQRWFVLGWIDGEGTDRLPRKNLYQLIREREFILRAPDFPVELIDFDGSRPIYKIEYWRVAIEE